MRMKVAFAKDRYRTTDHLFTLHALINHYIKVEKK